MRMIMTNSQIPSSSIWKVLYGVGVLWGANYPGVVIKSETILVGGAGTPLVGN